MLREDFSVLPAPLIRTAELSMGVQPLMQHTKWKFLLPGAAVDCLAGRRGGVLCHRGFLSSSLLDKQNKSFKPPLAPCGRSETRE